MAQNIIELNGKRYDAVTGALLGVAKTKQHLPGTPSSQRGRVIDGFIRQSPGVGVAAITGVQPAKKTPAHATKPVTHAKTLSDVVKKQGQHAVSHAPRQVQPHKPQRPQTLMRHVVKKPQVKMKTAIKTQATSGIAARPASEIAIPLEKKLSVTQVNPVRLARATHAPKSHHIRRFAKQHAPAAAQKSHTPVTIPASARVAATTSVKPAVATPSQGTPGVRSTRPAAHTRPDTIRAQYAAVRQKPQAITPHTVKQQEPVDIFEAAIAHARTHERQLRPIKRNNRVLNWAAGFGAFLLIAGFVSYLNMNAIQLQVASMRAGFSADLPGYQPTGYALGPIESQKGKISLKFTSGESAYRVTQQASDWDSQTLYDNYVSSLRNPETIESKGRTIYLYNGNNATWVNGGVRYEIDGNNASLSSDELVALATSM